MTRLQPRSRFCATSLPITSSPWARPALRRGGRAALERKVAVIPGAGQWISQGQSWRGALYLAGIGAASYLAYDAHGAYDQAEQD